MSDPLSTRRHARVCTFDDSARPCDCPPGESCRALADDYDDSDDVCPRCLGDTRPDGYCAVCDDV